MQPGTKFLKFYGLGHEVFAKKFRESQSDWFGKRGIPWHISVAMRKNANNETEKLTFVHSFESCTQDSSALLAIIDDIFTQLKEIMPEMNSVYLPAIFVVRNQPRLWHTQVCPRARNPVR